MSLYLTRARYNADAYKAMMASPSDRSAASRAIFESAGMKLHHMWLSSNGEAVCVVEGDAVSGAAVGMVVMGSGAFSDGETVELITPEQQVQAMKQAQKMVASYRAPGK